MARLIALFLPVALVFSSTLALDGYGRPGNFCTQYSEAQVCDSRWPINGCIGNFGPDCRKERAGDCDYFRATCPQSRPANFCGTHTEAQVCDTRWPTNGCIGQTTPDCRVKAAGDCDFFKKNCHTN